MTKSELKKKYPKVYQSVSRKRKFTVRDVAQAMNTTYTTAARMLFNLDAAVIDADEFRRTGQRGAPARLWVVEWD